MMTQYSQTVFIFLETNVILRERSLNLLVGKGNIDLPFCAVRLVVW